MAKKFREWQIEQNMLLPPSVMDFVPEGHLAHFVRELVKNELDLSSILEHYQEERGYPPYNPYMMTAVLLYSYMKGIYSSRKIAAACEERVDFMAVSGMNKPDFRTIASFRKRHLPSLGGIFITVLKLCKEAKLVKMGHVALDGSKVKANASKSKSKSYKKLKKEERELRAEVDRWFAEAEASDETEDEQYGEDCRGDELPAWVKDKEARARKLKEARESLEAKDKQEREEREQAVKEGRKARDHQKKRTAPAETRRHNFTDSDSEMMKTRDGYIQGYNTQIAVDAESYVIVSSNVTTAKNDFEELSPTLEQFESSLGELPEELSADTGYCTEENLQELSNRGVRGYVAVGSKNPGIRARATIPGTQTHTMSQRIRKGGKRSRYWLRGKTVEPVFGVLKSNRNFQQFLLRGLECVKNEWLLVCTAYNLHKLAAARS